MQYDHVLLHFYQLYWHELDPYPFFVGYFWHIAIEITGNHEGVCVCVNKQKKIEWNDALNTRWKAIWLSSADLYPCTQCIVVSMQAAYAFMWIAIQWFCLWGAFIRVMGFRSSGFDGSCWLTCPIPTCNQYYTVIYDVIKSVTREYINLKYNRLVGKCSIGMKYHMECNHTYMFN